MLNAINEKTIYVKRMTKNNITVKKIASIDELVRLRSGEGEKTNMKEWSGMHFGNNIDLHLYSL